MFSRFDRHYFDLLWSMTQKEFTSRYKRASFGFLWIFINPIAQMLIIGTVFSHYIKLPNYHFYIITGLLPWHFFTNSLQAATFSFVNQRALLQKTVFPKDILPFSIVFSNLLHLLITQVIIITAAFFITKPSILMAFMIFPALSWIAIFLAGFSLLTSSLNVRFRDVSFFIQSLTLLWFYATPIFYSFESMPPRIQNLMVFNPLAAPFVLIRTALLNQPYPPLHLLIVNALTTLLVITLGIIVYKKQNKFFVDWL